ncbi:MAG: hypothetical protein ACXWZM_03400 [Solirubrobacterales bacterium]
MAKGDQHRMVFDIRGRRRNVVKVVYAALAVLMGLSLLTVVGPVSIGDVFGGGSTGSVTSNLDDQAAAIEKKLNKQPQNEGLWLSLARTRFSAGSTLAQTDPSTGQTVLSEDASGEFRQGAKAWNSYLELHPQPPNPNVAQLAANASFTLAQNSTSYPEAYKNLRDAAAAQAVVAAARPSAGTYSNLAAFSYLAGDFKGGDAAASKAAAEVPAAQRKNVKKSLAAYRKQGEQLKTQQKIAAQAQQGQGKQKLENPVGGLAGGGLGGSTPTP